MSSKMEAPTCPLAALAANDQLFAYVSAVIFSPLEKVKFGLSTMVYSEASSFGVIDSASTSVSLPSVSNVTRPSYSWLTTFHPDISLVSLGSRPFDGSVTLTLTTLSALATLVTVSFVSTDPQPASSATMESAAVIGLSRPVVMLTCRRWLSIAVLSINGRDSIASRHFPTKRFPHITLQAFSIAGYLRFAPIRNAAIRQQIATETMTIIVANVQLPPTAVA